MDFLLMKQTVLFEDILCKPVEVEFSDERLTSDAGSTLLIAVDKKLGLTESIAELIPDGLDPVKVEHEVSEMLKQRTFAVSNGYEDANDAAKMKGDPLLKMACGRAPVKDADPLGSRGTKAGRNSGKISSPHKRQRPALVFDHLVSKGARC